MTVVYLVQHGEKERLPGDPGLTAIGRRQATRTGRWLRARGVQTLCTSPLGSPPSPMPGCANA